MRPAFLGMEKVNSYMTVLISSYQQTQFILYKLICIINLIHHYLFFEGELNWTTSGCKTETIEQSDVIKCSCSHLTFFAVLMVRTQITSNHWNMLSQCWYINTSCIELSGVTLWLIWHHCCGVNIEMNKNINGNIVESMLHCDWFHINDAEALLN